MSAQRIARFCLATNMSPSEAKKLTVAEYNAFIDALGDREHG